MSEPVPMEAMMQRWIYDLVELGALGRKNHKKIRRFPEITEEDGLYRLEGTEAMRLSIEYLLGRMNEAGLETRFDSIGNLYGTYRGTDPEAPVVMSGSHLDSVGNGGMFDGAAGVIAALESIRRIKESDFRNRRNIEVCVFMGEEGSAVDEACLGSRVLAGITPSDFALAMKDANGRTLHSMLEGTGRLGESAPDLSRIGFFIELHIEQGPVLNTRTIPVGIVDMIVGIRAYRVKVTGRSNHAGTTPMTQRSDALAAASACITGLLTGVRERCTGGSREVVTFDTIDIFPGSPSVIPSEVRCTLDTRDVEENTLNLIENELGSRLKEAENFYGVTTNRETIMDYPPVHLDETVVSIIEETTLRSGAGYMRMHSGAIHDAMSLAGSVPTGMIFVPSRNGISHSPFEWTDWGDIEAGIKVLTGSLMRLSM